MHLRNLKFKLNMQNYIVRIGAEERGYAAVEAIGNIYFPIAWLLPGY